MTDNPAAMTERLIDAAIYAETASGVYVTAARKEVNDARAAIEAEISRLREAARGAPERAVEVLAPVNRAAAMICMEISEGRTASNVEAMFRAYEEADHTCPTGCGRCDIESAYADAARIRAALTAAPVPALAMPSRDWMREKIAADPDVEYARNAPVEGTRALRSGHAASLLEQRPSEAEHDATGAVEPPNPRETVSRLAAQLGVEDNPMTVFRAAIAVARKSADGTVALPDLVPDPAAGEVVAWAEQYGSKIVSVSLTQGRFHTVPLYAHPSPALKVAVEALKLVAAHDSVMARLEPDAHDAVRSALATIRAQEG